MEKIWDMLTLVVLDGNTVLTHESCLGTAGIVAGLMQLLWKLSCSHFYTIAIYNDWRLTCKDGQNTSPILKPVHPLLRLIIDFLIE